MSNKIAFLLGVVFVAIVVGGGIEYHEGSWDVSLLPQEASAQPWCRYECKEGHVCQVSGSYRPDYPCDDLLVNQYICVFGPGCVRCDRGLIIVPGGCVIPACFDGIGTCSYAFPPACP
jgi:hypothetical protein